MVIGGWAADKTKKIIIKERRIQYECGAPCWVCHKKNDLEVHHVFEWAFWNAMDPKKVTNILQAIEFYDSDYVGKAKKPAKLQKELGRITKAKRYLYTPDDIRNFVVICRKHHRLKITGMHTITFPIWLAMAAVPSRGGILTKR